MEDTYVDDDIDVDQEIIAEHVWLARKIARERRWQYKGLSPDDLLSEAYLGLCRGVEAWDPDLGELIPLAATYIRNQIRERFRQESVKLKPTPMDCSILEDRLADRSHYRKGRDPDTQAFEAMKTLRDQRVLSDRDCRITYWHFGHNATIEQLAVSFNLSVSSIKRIIKEAKEQIKWQLVTHRR